MMIVLSLAMVALVAASRAELRAACKAPNIMPANMLMIVIVTSSSTSVNAGRGGDFRVNIGEPLPFAHRDE